MKSRMHKLRCLGFFAFIALHGCGSDEHGGFSVQEERDHKEAERVVPAGDIGNDAAGIGESCRNYQDCDEMFCHCEADACHFSSKGDLVGTCIPFSDCNDLSEQECEADPTCTPLMATVLIGGCYEQRLVACKSILNGNCGNLVTYARSPDGGCAEFNNTCIGDWIQDSKCREVLLEGAEATQCR